jgi:acyl-CoA oxidase
VGTKLGYNAVDNGFLRFNQVRIPRGQHLCRFFHVDKDGSCSVKGDPRMLY